jgi:hypothetical protein
MVSTRNITVFGLVICIYGIYVEHKARHSSEDPSSEFTALCDIPAIGASCR